MPDTTQPVPTAAEPASNAEANGPANGQANTQASGKDPLASLAGQLRHASTGTLARLRRSHPDDSSAALFETERLLHAAQVPVYSADDHARWALVLHCLALAQGQHDARADAEPGAVFARLRLSEARLRQLVEADRPVLAQLLPRLARRLAAAGAAANWWPLAELILHTDRIDDISANQTSPRGNSHAQRADAARQRLVRHYLLAQRRASAQADAPLDA